MNHLKANHIIFPVSKEIDSCRKENIRKLNAKKNPNGYIYILQNKHFDLIKIGVSSNPKRRIQDIRSYIPFEVDCVFLKYYLDVYSLEKIIENTFSNNRVKGEWYQCYKEDVSELISILKDIE